MTLDAGKSKSLVDKFDWRGPTVVRKPVTDTTTTHNPNKKLRLLGPIFPKFYNTLVHVHLKVRIPIQNVPLSRKPRYPPGFHVKLGYTVVEGIAPNHSGH